MFQTYILYIKDKNNGYSSSRLVLFVDLENKEMIQALDALTDITSLHKSPFMSFYKIKTSEGQYSFNKDDLKSLSKFYYAILVNDVINFDFRIINKHSVKGINVINSLVDKLKGKVFVDEIIIALYEIILNISTKLD